MDITGESRYIVSRYLYPVIFLYPVPVILPFSLLPYWSIENCTAILSRVSTLFKLYLCNTALHFFIFKQRCIHRNSTSNLQINVSTQVLKNQSSLLGHNFKILRDKINNQCSLIVVVCTGS